MARQFETLGQYHDLWAVITLSAPDKFYDVGRFSLAADQNRALLEAFDDLRFGFHFARQKLKDERLIGVARELIEMSLEAYLSGDTKTGAHTLQECEGIIWPGRHIKVKYAVEAERRAFGKNVLYADVVVSPYPYEGQATDLGPEQEQLLGLAQRWCRSYQAEHRDFKYFSWVLGTDGGMRRTSAEPREDEHPVLRPIQRSRGYKRLKELGQGGQIVACVLMEIVGPLGDGVVSYELEQQGRPRVSARQLFKRRTDGVHYETMRFHLEDPDFFAMTPPAS